jgi:hypothetical protein
MPVYLLRRTVRAGAGESVCGGGSAVPGGETTASRRKPFSAPYAFRRQSMLIEPSICRPPLLREFPIVGDRVVIREFASTTERVLRENRGQFEGMR